MDDKRNMPDWLDGHIQLTEETEPPYLFRLWCGISTIAAALQRKVSLDWGTTLYPNMYIVLVAPAGKARKGTAMRPIHEYLADLDVPIAASSTTREALIRALSESSELYTSADGKAYEHSSLTIIAPELTVFLGYNNLALISDLTDWFDCAKKWVYRTKTQGTDDIRGVFINLLGATTPDLIRTALPPDAIGGGLTSRMIFVYEPRKGKIVAFPTRTEENKKMQRLLTEDLHKIALLKGKVKYTRSFLDVYGDWYHQTEDNPPFPDKEFAGYIERRPTHLLKLSMICNASRGSSLILEDKDFLRALEILTLTEVKMPQTYGALGTQKHAGVIQRIMSDLAVRKEISVADLLNDNWRDVNEAELQAIIKTLVQMNYALVAITTTGATVIRLKKAQLMNELEIR